MRKTLVVLLITLMVFGGATVASALEFSGQRDFTVRRELGKDNAHYLEYTEFVVMSINDTFGIGAKSGLAMNVDTIKELKLEILPLDLSLLASKWGLNFALGLEFYPLDKENDTKTLYFTTSKVW